MNTTFIKKSLVLINCLRIRNSSVFLIQVLALLFILDGCTHKDNEKSQATLNKENAADLCVGFASENITPPIGMRLCGTFEERLAEGVHDSLFVRAFVFEQGEEKFAIAGCDLAMVFPEICDAVRQRVAALGLPPDHILIHGSETHNGPDYFGEFRDVFHAWAMKKYGNDLTEPIDYNVFLVNRITEAILSADSATKPSEIRFSFGECKGIAFNRRFRMNDGSIGWNPGKLNPQILEPLGPVDESLPLISIYQDSPEVPSAILTGYALHLAILDDANYGADYPYYLSENLKTNISPDLFTHFMQPPCCEVNHIDVSTPEKQSGHDWAMVVGDKLAASILQILSDKGKPLQPDLKVMSMIVPLKLQEFSGEEIKKQREVWHSLERVDLHFLDVVYAGKVASIYDRHDGGPVQALLQAFQFDSETVLVGLPSEISVELGLIIKEKSPYKNTMIVQLSNDWFGYIPTE